MQHKRNMEMKRKGSFNVRAWFSMLNVKVTEVHTESLKLNLAKKNIA